MMPRKGIRAVARAVILFRTRLIIMNTLKKVMVLILYFFVSCNFMHNKNTEIAYPYYIIASDSESQATISLFLEKYDSWVGITPEGITEYAVLKDYILGKRETTENEKAKIEYDVIAKGSDKCRSYKPKEFLNFLDKNKIDSNKIQWKKI